MDESHLITKYTGHRLDPAALRAAGKVAGIAAALGEAIGQAALAVEEVDRELTHRIPSIIEYLTRVKTTVNAELGEPAPGLNPVGELQAQGPRFDTLIAMREERLQHLRTLLKLWNELIAPTADPERG